MQSTRSAVMSNFEVGQSVVTMMMLETIRSITLHTERKDRMGWKKVEAINASPHTFRCVQHTQCLLCDCSLIRLHNHVHSWLDRVLYNYRID